MNVAAAMPAPPPRPPLLKLPSAESLLQAARTETDRCTLVPRVSYAGHGEAMNDELVRPGAQWRLRPIQCEALRAIRHAGGGFLPIGVGHGKTLIALLAGTVLGVRHALVLTRPGVVSQMRRDLEVCRQNFEMRGAVDVQSYEWLSNPKNSDVLDRLVERLGASGLVIVADECHALKDRTSARTVRMARILDRYPEIRFVGLSGTVTSKSLRDFAHVAEWALRHCAPVPRGRTEAERRHLDAWSECIDARGRPTSSDWQTIQPLLDKFCPPDTTGDRREAAQRAFQARLRSSPGVVASEEGSLGTSLIIRPIRVDVPSEVAELLEQVYTKSIDPNGDVLPDDLSRSRVGHHLSLGYYQFWRWPNGVVDEEWMRARRGWAACVREEIEMRAEAEYDSEKLVRVRTQAELARGANEPRHRALRRWMAVWDRPEPPSVPRWVSYFLLYDVVERLNADPSPIIGWYQSTALEVPWAETDIPCYGHGTELPAARAHKCLASIAVHGTGRNLQAWSRNLVIQPPSSGETWEQLIGRTHRAGQEADEITVDVYAHTKTFKSAIAAARKSAAYIQNTTGNVQKLCIASWIDSKDGIA